MVQPLMPQATAVWLIDNSALTFKQIADFVGMHELEIQAIADGEIHAHIVPANPIEQKQLTADEITRCEADASASLALREEAKQALSAKKQGRYTPISRRRDKINAIAWLIQFQKDLSDGDICEIVQTTRVTIKSVRDGSHWDHDNIEARHPVEVGLVSRAQYDAFLHGRAANPTRRGRKKKEVAVTEE